MASRSWNRVELIGNLTRDPELRFTPSGAAVCTFSIATNRTYVSDGEKKEEVDFHRCVSWNKLAELCNQLLKKGNRAFISGRLQNRSWEAQDGQQRNVTEIVVEDMIVLTPRSDYAQAPVDMENINLDELPKVAPVKPAAEESHLKEDQPMVEKESVSAEPKSKESKGEDKDKKQESKAPAEDVSPDEDLPF